MIEIEGKRAQADEAAVRKKYERITKRLIEEARSVTTMESCTAGQIVSLLTDTEGSSAVVKGAFVTYSNEAKILAGVPEEVIRTYGVYSEETAAAMASSCRIAFQADLGIGVTGSFGNPDPKNADSVPGEVFFAIAAEKEILCFHLNVPPQDFRFQFKLYMADLIADQLLKIIG